MPEAIKDLNVEIDARLLKAAKMKALELDLSLKQFVAQALESYIRGGGREKK